MPSASLFRKRTWILPDASGATATTTTPICSPRLVKRSSFPCPTLIELNRWRCLDNKLLLWTTEHFSNSNRYYKRPKDILKLCIFHYLERTKDFRVSIVRLWKIPMVKSCFWNSANFELSLWGIIHFVFAILSLHKTAINWTAALYFASISKFK